jgi:hypothetical protein
VVASGAPISPPSGGNPGLGVRIHGRGGQGVVTTAELLAAAEI